MVVELDAGDAMTDRERLARVILDQISHFFVLLDTDGRVLEVNRAVLIRSGLDRQKVLGRTFLEVDWWGQAKMRPPGLRRPWDVRLMANPSMAILEVGADKGQRQNRVLAYTRSGRIWTDRICCHGVPRYHAYGA